MPGLLEKTDTAPAASTIVIVPHIHAVLGESCVTDCVQAASGYVGHLHNGSFLGWEAGTSAAEAASKTFRNQLHANAQALTRSISLRDCQVTVCQPKLYFHVADPGTPIHRKAFGGPRHLWVSKSGSSERNSTRRRTQQTSKHTECPGCWNTWKVHLQLPPP